MQTSNRERLEGLARSLSAPAAIYVNGAGMPSAFGMVLKVGPGIRAALPYETPLTINTPCRVASNTKPFTAAAVLRLAERGQLALDEAAELYLRSDTCAVLRAGGFRPDQITLRQLLAHTSGLPDHTDAPNSLEHALENPDRIWTRLEQVQTAVDLGGPLSAPGETYHYSDTGYVLLGEVIERVTGQLLGPAIRALLDFARFNLSSTWWEGMEKAPTGAKRAQQFVRGRDVTNIHPSIDTFGGGGLTMSVRDLGCLTAALFEGQLFRSPWTLAEMLRPTEARLGDEYRLGVSAMRIEGIEVFGHQGYWGTAAFHAPASKITVAGFVAERDDRAKMIDALLACLVSATEMRTVR